MGRQDDEKDGNAGKRQMKLPFVLRKAAPRCLTDEGNTLTLPDVLTEQSGLSASPTPKRIDPRKIAPTLPEESSTGIEILNFYLAPDSHPSLIFSCADKLLWIFADQIMDRKEISIAYPCLNCRGGLSLFLAYIGICAERNAPGKPILPILVYPGTMGIREAYLDLKIRVGDLLDGLRHIRVEAYRKSKKEIHVYPWEHRLLDRKRAGKLRGDEEYPLHDFFPAAVLDGESVPRIFTGRHGLGRGDDASPPLHFATRIEHVYPKMEYRAAILMHDALSTHAERKRLNRNIGRIKADSLVHLFESPYSPGFRRRIRSGEAIWRIKPEDFPPDGDIFLKDSEILHMLSSVQRPHHVPSPLDEGELRRLSENFRKLRKATGEDRVLEEVYTRLFNLHRIVYTLPVPVEDYEAVTAAKGLASIPERIEDLKEQAAAVGPVHYSLVDDSIQVIQSATERLRKDPARARGLLTETKKAMKEGHRIGIVFSNDVYADAIEKYLSKTLDCDRMTLRENNVHLIHIGALQNMDPAVPYDVLLFTGYRGGRVLRWVMSGRAKEMVVLVTEAEKRSMRYDIDEVAKAKDTWAPKRSMDRMAPISDGLPEEKFGKALGEVNPSLPTIPLDDERFVQGLMEYIPTRKADPSRETGPIRCLRVTFSRMYAYLPVEGMVTVVATSGTKEKKVKSLSDGDQVLFIDQAQSRSIYEIMLEEIKKAPEFTLAVETIQFWHRTLKAAFADSGMTYHNVHAKLKKAGSARVEGTIPSWIRGDVMAPLDPEDLRRVFAVFEIHDPEGRISAGIDMAAKKLRRIYRLYAKAVNAFLIKSAADARTEIEDVLEKHNLDIAAIRESVIKETVVRVSSEEHNVPASNAGRLYGL